MADQGRHADLKVIYRSVDITADLQPFLLSWSWTEGLEKADDLQITVQDSDGRWLMDECESGFVAGGDTVKDHSGQGNHGTPYGGPVYRGSELSFGRRYL